MSRFVPAVRRKMMVRLSFMSLDLHSMMTAACAWKVCERCIVLMIQLAVSISVHMLFTVNS